MCVAAARVGFVWGSVGRQPALNLQQPHPTTVCSPQLNAISDAVANVTAAPKTVGIVWSNATALLDAEVSQRKVKTLPKDMARSTCR